MSGSVEGGADAAGGRSNIERAVAVSIAGAAEPGAAESVGVLKKPSGLSPDEPNGLPTGALD
jgi:hypothetical protein